MTSSSGAYAIVKNAVRNNADNEIAEIEGLGPLAERARQLRAVVDAYVLSAKQRLGFVDRIVEFAVFDTAAQANDAGVTHEPKNTVPVLEARVASSRWRLALTQQSGS